MGNISRQFILIYVPNYTNIKKMKALCQYRLLIGSMKVATRQLYIDSVNQY